MPSPTNIANTKHIHIISLPPAGKESSYIKYVTPFFSFCLLPDVPKFPKEKIDPLVVEEGQPFVLECNPPSGIPPLQIYWMTIGQ